MGALEPRSLSIAAGLALALLTGPTSPASANGWTATTVLVAETPTGNEPSERKDPTEEYLDSDPIEPVNRALFEVNEALWTLFFRPVVEVYDNFLPPPFQNGLGNVLSNLKSPVVLANDLLQGEGTRAWQTTQRMVINSTYGIGGLWDSAERFGIEGHEEDFGQTLAVWGLGELAYMVLPILGPTNPRDLAGKMADGFLDPLTWYLANTHRTTEAWGRVGAEGVDEYDGVKDELDVAKAQSLDYYAAIRSMYKQKRLAEIRNGDKDKLPPIPDFGQHRKRGVTSAAWNPTVRLSGGPSPKPVMSADWSTTIRYPADKKTAPPSRPVPTPRRPVMNAGWEPAVRIGAAGTQVASAD